MIEVQKVPGGHEIGHKDGKKYLLPDTDEWTPALVEILKNKIPVDVREFLKRAITCSLWEEAEVDLKEQAIALEEH